MVNQNIYGQGRSYEMLLRYAFKLNGSSFSKGADSSIYETLLHIENGLNLIKGNTHEKQFLVIKQHLEKGFKALANEVLFSVNERNTFNALKLKLGKAYNEPQLRSIIDDALDIVIEYKELL